MWTRFVHGLVRKGAFVGKELIEVKRQPRLILSLVLGPFLILLLFGIGYRAGQPDIPAELVFPPNMQASTDLDRYQALFAPPFKLVAVTKDRDGALDRLRRRQVHAVILFPQDAFATISSGRQATLQVLYNEIDPLTASWLQYYSYVQTTELNKEILVQALQRADAQRQNGTQDLQNTAGSMAGDARALQDDLAGGNTTDALVRVASLRKSNARAQDDLISSAEVLGGVALFLGVQQPEQTPQGKAVLDSQNAIQDINANLDQLQNDLRDGRAGPQDAERAGKIADDANRLKTSSAQIKLIPPQVVVSPFQSESRNINPITPSFVAFYAPAVIALLVQHIAVTLTALTLVRERLLGTVELFRVSPLSATEVAGGKYASYFILTVILAVLLSVAMYFGLQVPILGRYWLYALALGLLILASLSYGFFISAVSNTESQAVQLSMLVLLASVFFGGFFLALSSLLPFVRVVSYILPVTYGIAALQAVMLRGEFPPPYTLGALAGMAILLFVVSTVLFKHQFRRG